MKNVIDFLMKIHRVCNLWQFLLNPLLLFFLWHILSQLVSFQWCPLKLLVCLENVHIFNLLSIRIPFHWYRVVKVSWIAFIGHIVGVLNQSLPVLLTILLGDVKIIRIGFGHFLIFVAFFLWIWHQLWQIFLQLRLLINRHIVIQLCLNILLNLLDVDLTSVFQLTWLFLKLLFDLFFL